MRAIAMDRVAPTHTPSQSGKPTTLTAFHAPPVNLPQMAVRLGALIARQGLQARQEVVVLRLAKMISGHPRVLQCACRVETGARSVMLPQENARHAALDFI